VSGEPGIAEPALAAAPSLAAAFALLLVVAVVGFLVVSSYNAVMALRQRIDKAWSNIDVVLKQRHDQLPALVSAVRGLMTFEAGVLDDVAAARAAYRPTAPIPDQAAVSATTTTAVTFLLATVEAYPDLKSHQNVLELQDQIARLESMLADRRELYNDQVYRYNTRITTWPTLPLAWLLGWRARPFFAAEPDATARPETNLG
jgi:LemA protein